MVYLSTYRRFSKPVLKPLFWLIVIVAASIFTSLTIASLSFEKIWSIQFLMVVSAVSYLSIIMAPFLDRYYELVLFLYVVDKIFGIVWFIVLLLALFTAVWELLGIAFLAIFFSAIMVGLEFQFPLSDDQLSFFNLVERRF